MNLQKHWPVLLLITGLAFTGILYFPGLAGGYLLDDWAALEPLAAYGVIDSLEQLRLFLFGGVFSMFGRPLVLLSFYLDSNQWPVPASVFKKTNILLHLLNGAMLFWCGRLVLTIGGLERRRASVIALIATMVWLLHPLHVSSVLYVVQRMTELVTLAVLCGIAVYCTGRANLDRGRVRRGYAQMTIAVFPITLVAILSKENGVLLPMLLGVLELTVFSNSSQSLADPADSRRFRLWRRIVLGGASVLIMAALLLVSFTWYGTLDEFRGFGPFERFLTEMRVLVRYLFFILVPQSATGGVYQDDISISTSLISPPTTLIALFAIGVLIATAWRLRRKQPLFAMAVLFYFAAHTVESTFLSLELYFEHRNYLPSLFLAFPVAAVLTGPGAYRTARHVLLLIVGALLIFTTHNRVNLWADPVLLQGVWAKQRPASLRAQASYAQVLMNRGADAEAFDVLSRALKRFESEPFVNLLLLEATCKLGFPLDEMKSRIINISAVARRDLAMVNQAAQAFVDRIGGSVCPDLDVEFVRAMIDAALSNPFVDSRAGIKSEIMITLGKLEYRLGRAGPGAGLFLAALEEYADVEHVLHLAAFSATKGYPEHGYELIEAFKRMPEKRKQHRGRIYRARIWLSGRTGFNDAELDRLFNLLKAEMESKAGTENEAAKAVQ